MTAPSELAALADCEFCRCTPNASSPERCTSIDQAKDCCWFTESDKAAYKARLAASPSAMKEALEATNQLLIDVMHGPSAAIKERASCQFDSNIAALASLDAPAKEAAAPAAPYGYLYEFKGTVSFSKTRKNEYMRNEPWTETVVYAVAGENSEPIVWQYRVMFDKGCARENEWCDWHDAGKKYFDKVNAEIAAGATRVQTRALYTAPPLQAPADSDAVREACKLSTHDDNLEGRRTKPSDWKLQRPLAALTAQAAKAPAVSEADVGREACAQIASDALDELGTDAFVKKHGWANLRDIVALRVLGLLSKDSSIQSTAQGGGTDAPAAEGIDWADFPEDIHDIVSEAVIHAAAVIRKDDDVREAHRRLAAGVKEALDALHAPAADREAVARIIDPDAFASDEMIPISEARRRDKAIRKADAILALHASTSAAEEK
jgi:hypothetical protein